jgi:GNAT superfamily N-acetyltransferase
VLRRATPRDADAIAGVLTAARAAQSWFPRVHTADDDRRFVRERLLSDHDVWVVEEAGRVVAFAAIKGDLLGHIFVHPDEQGRGIGTQLLDKTKELLPEGFSLWTHQVSEARRFYDARGLVAVEFTDGSTTMEKLPDVRYSWRPASRGSAAR